MITSSQKERSLLKQTLSALLALLMISTAFTSTAFADKATPQGKGASTGDKPVTQIDSPATQELAAACNTTFSDVKTTDWFYTPVLALACSGVISGYGDGTFRPYSSVTRGQVAKLVVKAFGWPLQNPAQARFSDVAVSSTYFSYVETAAARGTISGYADGTFKPGAQVTRSQLSKIVVVAKGWTPCGSCSPHFSDVSSSNPFFGYVERAVAQGVISGYADGTFKPGNSATRAQFSAVLQGTLSASGVSGLAPTTEEDATISLINERRVALGLQPLQVNSALVVAARSHSADIGPRGLCQHNGTDGSSPWSRATDAGYTGFAMGEVVGCAYFTPTEVVNGWWASSGHHDILVNPAANEIGCGWWISRPGGAAWQTCITGQK